MKDGDVFNPYGIFHGLFIPNGIAQSSMTDPAKLLLGRLIQYAGKNGKAFPTRKKLADELSWSLTKVDRNIRLLKNSSLIETYQRDEQSPSTYVFLYNKMYDGAVEYDKGGATKSDSRGAIESDEQNNTNINNTNINNILSKDKSQKQVLAEKQYIEPLQIFNYSEKTKSILNLWNNLGGKIHKRKIAKTPEMIETMIQELLHKGRNPFAPVTKKNTKKLITKKFTIKEIKRSMKFYVKDLCKPIEHLYFHEFILFRKNGQPSLRDNSPLAETFVLLPEKSESTNGTKLLKRKLKSLRPKEMISNIVYVKADKAITKITKKYQVHDGASPLYHYRIINVFIEYVINKCNDQNFKLGYISGETFHSQFLEDALKNYQLQRR